MIAELEKRTRAMFVDEDGTALPDATHLDYVELVIAGGKTMNRLAFDLASATGDEAIIRSMLSTYLLTTFDDARKRLEAARTEGAHGIAESALDISDEEVFLPADIGRQRNRVAARQWLAERLNREAYGAPKAAPIEVDVRVLHLDALRARSVSLVSSKEDTSHMLEAGRATARATVADAELVDALI